MRRTQGFSLIELAIGLVIVTLLLSALVIPLATQMDQRRTAETQRLLSEAREALLAFAIGNGRLPCPATDTSNGQESFDAGATPPGDATNGVCARSRGFLPAVTLGLSPVDAEGYQTDAFGNKYNRIRYAVWNGDVDGPAGVTLPAWYYTKKEGMKNWGSGNMLEPLNAPSQPLFKGFFICSKKSNVDNGCDPQPGMVKLANSNAVAVVWSVGKNGADPSRTLAAGTLKADEGANLEPSADTNMVFVDRPYSSRPDDEFDDILLWISPGMLVGRLTAAGKPVN